MRLIDADALIENIKGYSQIEGTKLSKADEKIIECFISHVEMLEPTVEAKEVVHGEWIHDINNLYGCSECMNRETMSAKSMKNFCPNFGADMTGK